MNKAQQFAEAFDAYIAKSNEVLDHLDSIIAKMERRLNDDNNH